MAFWDRVTEFFATRGPDEARAAPWFEYPDLQTQIIEVRRGVQAERPWRLASVREALGVPAIQGAVTLISNATGSLTIQGFRNGALMPETPRLIARPDPYRTPRAFYRDSAYSLATRGDTVWWIASRDPDGLAASLVVVPANEVHVDQTIGDPLRPAVRWGDRKSTWWTPVTPEGEFVHLTYLQEPGELRGMGPLQMGMAAVSVAVESQEWAANFYAEGGNGGTLIKSAVPIDQDEAAELKAQWIGTPNNVPKVIDPDVEDVKQTDVNPQGAQMLQARDFQTGESARMFRIPGALLEYGAPGSSLTYANLADVWVNFVRGCLAPNYLEPIEQAMSDLLPRSTAARFAVAGLQRADDKTRWEIYQIALAVLGPERAAELAEVGEMLSPGNPEVAPVPFTPPALVPTALPEVRSAIVESELRCDGQFTMRRNGVSKLGECRKLLSRTGSFVGQCPRCHKVYDVAA